MRKVLIITAALVAFGVPVGTAAAHTSKADKREAKQECRAERGTTAATREAFETKWGGFGHCLHQTAREAKAERKPFAHHLTHLAVHGYLHLAGYDHEDDDEAEAMEKLEIAILARLKVPNPYVARARKA